MKNNYIQYLEETLLSETSYNNLMLTYNEGIIETIGKIISWICEKIKSICKFIVNVISKIFLSIIGLFSKKKKDNTPEGGKVEVPKAVGFANQVMNDLNINKLESLCYSKQDRTEEIENKKKAIIDNCLKCREMTKTVTVEMAKKDATRFETESKATLAHLNKLKNNLEDIEKEIRKDFEGKKIEGIEIPLPLKNTTSMLNMITSVMQEFTKTAAHYVSLYKNI